MKLKVAKIKFALDHALQSKIHVFIRHSGINNETNQLNDLEHFIELIEYYKVKNPENIVVLFNAIIFCFEHHVDTLFKPAGVFNTFTAIMHRVDWPELEQLIDLIIPLSYKAEKTALDYAQKVINQLETAPNKAALRREKKYIHALNIKNGSYYLHFNFTEIASWAVQCNQINIIYKLLPLISEMHCLQKLVVCSVEHKRLEIFDFLIDKLYISLNKDLSIAQQEEDTFHHTALILKTIFKSQDIKIIKYTIPALFKKGLIKRKFQSTEYFYALKLADNEVIKMVRDIGFDLDLSFMRTFQNYLNDDESLEIQKKMFEEIQGQPGFVAFDYIRELELYRSHLSEKFYMWLIERYPAEYFDDAYIYGNRWESAMKLLIKKRDIFNVEDDPHLSSTSNIRSRARMNTIISSNNNYKCCLKKELKQARARFSSVPYGSAGRLAVFRRFPGAEPAFISLVEMYYGNFESLIPAERAKIDETLLSFGHISDKLDESELFELLKSILTGYEIL